MTIHDSDIDVGLFCSDRHNLVKQIECFVQSVYVVDCAAAVQE